METTGPFLFELQEINNKLSGNDVVKLYNFDLTHFIRPWMESVSSMYPELSKSDVKNMLFYNIEATMLNYISNAGYIDEHAFSIFEEGTSNIIDFSYYKTEINLYDIALTNVGIPSAIHNMFISYIANGDETDNFIIGEWLFRGESVKVTLIVYKEDINMLLARYGQDE